MSVIINVAIIAHKTEADAIGAMNAALPCPLSDRALLNGGNKVGSLAAWGGAYNYLDWEGLAESARSTPWRFPDWVTIIRWHESGDPDRLTLKDLP